MASSMLLRTAALRSFRVAAPRVVMTPRVLSTPATDDVVVPELAETLEWVLDSPPPIHQFDEPPIVVEIAGVEPATGREPATS